MRRWDWIESMVKRHGWTRGAELGLCNGDTFLHLLDRCPNLTMIGVDLWEAQPSNDGPENYVGKDHKGREARVRSGAERHGGRAIIIKDWTLNAANQIDNDSLDFVFIDADHSEDGVRADILAWLPKIKDSGWILGHDIDWPTVRSVVDELLPGYVIGSENTWGISKERA